MKNFFLNRPIITGGLCVLMAFACQAQTKKTLLTKQQKQKIVASIGQLMKDNYVFSEGSRPDGSLPGKTAKK